MVKKAKAKPAPKRRAKTTPAKIKGGKSGAKPKLQSKARQIAPRLAKTPRPPKGPLSDDVFVLIAEGSFPRAASLIAPSPTEAEALPGAADAFNYAAAAWGRDGVPSLPLFKRAFELATQLQREKADSANFHQCLALAAAVVGNRAVAQSALRKSRQLASQLGTEIEFSAWRYRDTSRAEFLKDLAALERMFDDRSVLPAFVAQD